MVKKNPFDKEQPTKIPFSELMELIGTSCDYKFCIIDENIDEELMSLAASHGINLKGFKHVIETSGIQHAEKRHGLKSNDRAPLSLEDYLLIPFIIKNRDKVEVSAQTDISHHNTVLKYTKQIGDTYYYVEEIRKRKRKPLKREGLICYRWREHPFGRPLRLDNPLVFHSVSATNCLQKYNFSTNPQGDGWFFSFYQGTSSHVIPALACAVAWDLWLRLVFTFLLLDEK